MEASKLQHQLLVNRTLSLARTNGHRQPFVHVAIRHDSCSAAQYKSGHHEMANLQQQQAESFLLTHANCQVACACSSFVQGFEKSRMLTTLLGL